MFLSSHRNQFSIHREVLACRCCRCVKCDQCEPCMRTDSTAVLWFQKGSGPLVHAWEQGSYHNYLRPLQRRRSRPLHAAKCRSRGDTSERGGGGVTLRCVVPFPWVKGEAPTWSLCKPLLNQTEQSFGWGVSTFSTTFTRPKGSGRNTHLWPAWRHVFAHNIVGLMFAAIQGDMITRCCWTNTLWYDMCSILILMQWTYTSNFIIYLTLFVSDMDSMTLWFCLVMSDSHLFRFNNNGTVWDQ